ncbi:DNA polymerase subunit gamma-2, mitochondrial [Chiloscyllium plagiosum]|uniref:DNA polymerase subunit gamma-2, mitochondrial n=1 Tax=Chiloscyllium plagiosum TaxID=36176 RepID=UPI001CB88840|nr:DNA polymerase subunit gamma-2, mitochondrial [Chiloscyllium plagiosum]XP_043570974.1 DNA polymerase subunit gamma-2, mitochondrial [Chiloscyllium plagiosum]
MNLTIMGSMIMKFPFQSFLKKKLVSSQMLQQHWQIFGLFLLSRKYNKCTDLSGFTEAVIELCQSRHFITGDIITQDALTNGWYNYGHLGMELNKNLATEWWDSMVLSREQVFGVATPHKLVDCQSSDNRSLRLIETPALQVPSGNKDVTKEEIVALLDNVLKESTILRPNLLKGAIQEYTRSLNLVNRKLPFGLAEIGVCYQPFPTSKHPTAYNIVRTGEVDIASLVWFSSPRTSGQWLDYWIRQRLLWWRKFAKNPSNFTAGDFQDHDGTKGAALYFSFPWGMEPIEKLLNLGDKQLVLEHHGNKTNLKGRDGRKTVIPHVLSVSGNLDRGALALLFDSLQLTKNVESKHKFNQKKVLKLHPRLSPIKVGLDMGKGPTVELRQVCEGLFRSILEKRITVWPGYLETMHTSLEQLIMKYDEMGVIFTIVISDTTLESGLVQLRNRDTAVKELAHISEVRDFLTKYIQES